jgi:glycosyltransferase involved in cell wall biosynthesis
MNMSNANSPKVSVIIPTYNCARYIVQTVESVFAQTYADFELIVIDDGSTDNTRDLLAPYIAANRLIYLHQQNAGESVARNNGIRHAHGEYIAFLDSDDWWTPDKLALQVPALDAAPQAVMAYTYSFAVDNDGQPIRFRGGNRMSWGQPGLHEMFETLVVGNVIANPNTVLARTAALLQTTLFDEEIEWGEDWRLWLQLAQMGPFLFTPAETACYRMRRPGRRLEIEASDEFVTQNEIILQRTFEAVKQHHADKAAWLRLEPTAFRELYIRSAIHNAELGDTARTKRYLEKINNADPNAFAKVVADTGFRLASDTGDAQHGLAFITRIFDCLPATQTALLAMRGKALAEFHMAAAFTEYAKGNATSTRQHVVHAMRGHWPNLRNRGLWAIGLKSLMKG